MLIYSGPDFLSALDSKVQDEASDVEIAQAFVVFDREKIRFITSGNLHSVMEILGQKVNKEQLGAVFKEADLDSDGVINCTCRLLSSYHSSTDNRLH